MSATDANAMLADFITGFAKPGAPPDPVAAFHAVRNLPYLSSGDRSLEGVLARRAGSCSGKHILLAALLNRMGITARVELVLGDFAAPFRGLPQLPPALAAAARTGIRDIHNIVRAEINGVATVLDATWHDAMRAHGLRVNHSWAGKGDTIIAVDVAQMLGPSQQPAEDKARLIAAWPKIEQQERRRFLDAVNDWTASITHQHQNAGEEPWREKQ